MTAVASQLVDLGWPERDRALRRRRRSSPPTSAAASCRRPADGEGDINDPARRLVGQQGEAAAPFKAGLGRVFVDGKEWAAELDGGGDLAAKTKVEVTRDPRRRPAEGEGGVGRSSPVAETTGTLRAKRDGGATRATSADRAGKTPVSE